jgi:hypothetical protein
MAKKKTTPVPVLKGWAAIAMFLGTSPSSAQGWAKQGMPVKREGRFAIADPSEVQAWLGRQSHMPKPAHILTGSYRRCRHCGSAQRFYFCCEEEEIGDVRPLQTHSKGTMAQRVLQHSS